jgi:hypothetical protein
MVISPGALLFLLLLCAKNSGTKQTNGSVGGRQEQA